MGLFFGNMKIKRKQFSRISYCILVGRLPIKIPLGARSGLRMVPCYEVSGDLEVDAAICSEQSVLVLAVVQSWSWGAK